MDLGAQSQTEIKLEMLEARHRARMNSALPYIDPHLKAKVLEWSSSHTAPTCAPSLAAFLQPTHLLPACLPRGIGSASILGLQVCHPCTPPQAVSPPRGSG